MPKCLFQLYRNSTYGLTKWRLGLPICQPAYAGANAVLTSDVEVLNNRIYAK